ncbi:hypothetical protein [Dactylosporangium sp. NPDC051541]|uniref:hypothetical protein n=1 Tax=Dactylosporangium sp. NPDC051541 TaxID=3363977 RepID=UPI003788D120
MGVDLLHKPVVDLAGMPVGTVDGVETVVGVDGTREISALVVEPRRLFGFGNSATRMRISWDLVAFCDRSITLMVRKSRLQPS